MIKLLTFKHWYRRQNSVYLACFEKLEDVTVLGKPHLHWPTGSEGPPLPEKAYISLDPYIPLSHVYILTLRMSVDNCICTYKSKNYTKKENNNKNWILPFLEYNALVGRCDSPGASFLEEMTYKLKPEERTKK